MELPKRVFNSPLVRYINFADGSHVNLIKLSKPYANGDAYAIHETTKSIFCSNGMFKTFEDAIIKFNLMAKNASKESSILSSGFIFKNL